MPNQDIILSTTLFLPMQRKFKKIEQTHSHEGNLILCIFMHEHQLNPQLGYTKRFIGIQGFTHPTMIAHRVRLYLHPTMAEIASPRQQFTLTGYMLQSSNVSNTQRHYIEYANQDSCSWLSTILLATGFISYMRSANFSSEHSRDMPSPSRARFACDQQDFTNLSM